MIDGVNDEGNPILYAHSQLEDSATPYVLTLEGEQDTEEDGEMIAW